MCFKNIYNSLCPQHLEWYCTWEYSLRCYRGSMVGLFAALSSSREAHCCRRSSAACFIASLSSSPSCGVGQEIWLKLRKVLVKSAPKRSNRKREIRGIIIFHLREWASTLLQLSPFSNTFDTSRLTFYRTMRNTIAPGWLLHYLHTSVMHGLHKFCDEHLVLWFLYPQQTQFLPHVAQIEVIVKRQILIQHLLSPVRR